MVIKPGESNSSSSLKCGSSKSIVNQVMAVTAIPGSTLTRNSRSQEVKVGEIAAHGRPDGWCQRRDEPDNGRNDVLHRSREDREHGACSN